jgi:hypothetical protein
VSEANLAAIEDAGPRFIVGMRIPDIPYQVSEWRRGHQDEPIGDGQIFTQPWVMGTKTDPRRRTISYQYRADRARRTLKGIDQQIANAEKAVAGQAAVKRNWFIQLSGGTKSINRRPGGESPRPGRAEGLRHQPGDPHRRVRDGRLPPTLAD